MDDIEVFKSVVFWSVCSLAVFGITSVMSMMIFDRWFKSYYCDICQKRLAQVYDSSKKDGGIKIQLED